MEGDTPDNSEADGESETLEELGDAQSSYNSSEDDTFVAVLSRRAIGGALEYWVRYDDGSEGWIDRSDAWDFMSNTLKLREAHLTSTFLCNRYTTSYFQYGDIQMRDLPPPAPPDAPTPVCSAAQASDGSGWG